MRVRTQPLRQPRTQPQRTLGCVHPPELTELSAPPAPWPLACVGPTGGTHPPTDQPRAERAEGAVTLGSDSPESWFPWTGGKVGGKGQGGGLGESGRDCSYLDLRVAVLVYILQYHYFF